VAAYGAPIIVGIGGAGGSGGNVGTGGDVGTGGSGGANDAGGQGATDAATDSATAGDASEDRASIAIYGAAFVADKEPTS
jgi:hypothetical protein